MAGHRAASTIARRHADRSIEFSLLVAVLLPGCLAVELRRPTAPAAGAPRAKIVAGALDRARGFAALAFSLPG